MSIQGSDVHEENLVGIMAGKRLESPPADDKGLYTKAKADPPVLEAILKVRENFKYDGRRAREAVAGYPPVGATEQVKGAEASTKTMDAIGEWILTGLEKVSEEPCEARTGGGDAERGAENACPLPKV